MQGQSSGSGRSGEDEEGERGRRGGAGAAEAGASAGAAGDRDESSGDSEEENEGSALHESSIDVLDPLFRVLAARAGMLPDDSGNSDEDGDYVPSDEDDEEGDDGEGAVGPRGGPAASAGRRRRGGSQHPRHARHPHEQEQLRALQDHELADDLSAATDGLAMQHAVRLRLRGERAALTQPQRVNLAMRVLPSRPCRRLMGDVRSRIYSSQFSRSGDWLVCAAQDSCVRILDAKQWRVHKTIEARDIHWTVTSTDLSPDERFLMYSTISDCVQLCNVTGDYEVHEPLVLGNGEGFGVWCAKFAAGGTELIAGTSDESVVIYDIERKQQVAKVRAHDDDINAVEFADRHFKAHVFYSGSDDNLIKVWDRRVLGNGRQGREVGVLAGHSDGLTSVSSRGDGVYLVSNAKDQTAKLWDMRRMRDPDQQAALPGVPQRFQWDYRWMDYPGWHRPYKHPHDCSLMTYRGHEVLNTLIRAYFSPAQTTGQRYIYSGSRDGAVYIWDVLSGELKSKLVSFTAQGRTRAVHRAPVRDVTWHPTLPVLCSSSWDGTVVVWEYDAEHDASAPAESVRSARPLSQLVQMLMGGE